MRGLVQKKEKFRVNGKITAMEVRVVDEAGGMLGVMPADQAMETARQKGLDLVEIAPKAKPPTCKIMDYGKWKFKMSKKEKHSRKNQVKVIIKEIQLRPRTEAHDLEIKMRKAKEFLTNGWKVKVHLRYSGREMAHKELGLEALKRVITELNPFSSLETEVPQMEKRSAYLFFSPNATLIKESQKKKKKSVAQKPATTTPSETNVVEKTAVEKTPAEKTTAEKTPVKKAAVKKAVEKVVEKAMEKTPVEKTPVEQKSS